MAKHPAAPNDRNLGTNETSGCGDVSHEPKTCLESDIPAARQKRGPEGGGPSPYVTQCRQTYEMAPSIVITG